MIIPMVIAIITIVISIHHNVVQSFHHNNSEHHHDHHDNVAGNGILLHPFKCPIADWFTLTTPP